MGIPKFFRYISERWPNMLQSVNDSVIPEFDNLYLDMNSIIHNATRTSNDVVIDNEEEIFKNVFNYIEHLFYLIKPKRVFYMAIDGVAPRAKMNQQRSRRFRAALEQEEAQRALAEAGIELNAEEPFDRNCITPGTEFMARLTVQLKYFISRKVSDDSNWQSIQVILSGHEVPGEGEHKIMNFIRELRCDPDYAANTRHCLYGADADLIMLGLTTHEPHFSILRENVTYGSNKSTSARSQELDQMKLYLLHLSMTRDYIELEFDDLLTEETSSGERRYDFERMLDDFILINFFIGNDFLPELPMLLVSDGAIPIILQTYSRFLRTHNCYLTNSSKLDFAALKLWMVEMSKFQLQKFEDLAKDASWFNNSLDTISPLNVADEPDALQQLTDHQRGLVSDLKPYILSTFKDDFDGGPLQLDDDCIEELKFVGLLAKQCGLTIVEQKGSDGETLQMLTAPDELNQLDPQQRREKRSKALQVVRVYERQTLSAQESEKKSEIYQQKLDIWRGRYYKSKFNADLDSDVVKDVVHNYLEGLQWVLTYYYKGCASWDWFYCYHYAPMTMDLIKGITSDFEVKFEQTEPAKPFEQLLAVMSHRSAKLLPPAYRSLMTEPSSPIIDFYPHTFAVDLNGKKRDWEGVVLIPFVDMSKLRSAMEAANSKLTKAELQRNVRGVELGFNYDPNLTFVYQSPLSSLPNIDRCHCRIKELDLDVVSQSKQVFGMTEGSKVGNNLRFGFPSLKHLDFDFHIASVGVRVFEFDSRIESIVISIKKPARSASVAEVAARLLDQHVYVDYPFLCEANVTGVSQNGQYFVKRGNEIVERPLDSSEKQTLHRQTASYQKSMMQRRAIETGPCSIMVHFQRFEGMLRDDTGAIKKQFGNSKDTEDVIPLQLVVEDVASKDERFLEQQARPVEEEFPQGTRGLLLLSSEFGSPAQVVSHGDNSLEVVFLHFYSPAPTQTKQIAMRDAATMKFSSATECCKRLRMNPLQFSRLTSFMRVEVNGTNSNLGLPLKKTQQNQKIVGYTRLGPRSWEYSDAAIELVREYVTAFPDLITRVFQSVQNVPDIGAGLQGAELEHVVNRVKAARKWIRDHTAGLDFANLEDQRMSSEAISQIEKWACSYSANPPEVSREGLKNLPRGAFVATDQAAPVLCRQSFAPGDRVVFALSFGKVPQFSHGTVVGIYHAKTQRTLDVVFDEELSGGSNFGGSLSSNRGASVDATSVLNISSMEVAYDRKGSKSFTSASRLGSTANQARQHHQQATHVPKNGQKQVLRPGVKLSNVLANKHNSSGSSQTPITTKAFTPAVSATVAPSSLPPSAMLKQTHLNERKSNTEKRTGGRSKVSGTSSRMPANSTASKPPPQQQSNQPNAKTSTASATSACKVVQPKGRDLASSQSSAGQQTSKSTPRKAENSPPKAATTTVKSDGPSTAAVKPTIPMDRMTIPEPGQTSNQRAALAQRLMATFQK